MSKNKKNKKKKNLHIYILHPISSSYKANQSYPTHNANEKKEKKTVECKETGHNLKLNIVKTPSQPTRKHYTVSS